MISTISLYAMRVCELKQGGFGAFGSGEKSVHFVSPIFDLAFANAKFWNAIPRTSGFIPHAIG